MHQNKIPSLRSSGIYKWTSLSECHHTKCATERTPQVPVSEGTITGRGDGWKVRELQLLLCGACSSCCPCQASSRWPDSQWVLWVLRQLLPWLQGGQPSVALHNQVRGVLHRAHRRVRCRRLLQDLPRLHLRRGRDRDN
ncbi:hypothetical protein PAHAL_6G131800 [Panicum hallii]|uniref:Uncharacterized protein n=1 Tax=Panicum hallii TaxID=206008 RepID=A0A2T8IG78_9POAL|nr:hypothetical protein PAHAL_6G131800 [Panicum hallii]